MISYVRHSMLVGNPKTKMVRIIHLTIYVVCYLGHMKNSFMKENLKLRNKPIC
jgi:hypothetical protein